MKMDMFSFQNTALRFSPKITTVIRGRHGIGKSQGVYQIATKVFSQFYESEENCKRFNEVFGSDGSVVAAQRKFWKKNRTNPKYEDFLKAHGESMWHHDMGLPVVERRLSQMTEGDMLGLPVISGLGTRFTLSDWYQVAAAYPVVLFLDELNRAIPQVRQGTFQIGDSHSYYGVALHDETRVFIAINNGASYQVEMFDPAELSRYAIVDLDPSKKDWVVWAKENCNPILPEFIQNNDSLLEMEDPKNPEEKTPDRRAWARLDEELTTAGLYDDPADKAFLFMSAMMVGHAAGNKFTNYVRDNANRLSVDDMLKVGWFEYLKKLPTQKDKYAQATIELSEKLQKHLEKSENVEIIKANTGMITTVADFFYALDPERAKAMFEIVNKSRIFGAMPSVNKAKESTDPAVVQVFLRMMECTAPTFPTTANGKELTEKLAKLNAARNVTYNNRSGRWERAKS